MVPLGNERNAMDPRRIRDVTQNLAGGPVDYHEMRLARDEDSARARLGNNVVVTPFAADVQTLISDVKSTC